MDLVCTDENFCLVRNRTKAILVAWYLRGDRFLKY